MPRGEGQSLGRTDGKPQLLGWEHGCHGLSVSGDKSTDPGCSVCGVLGV